MNSYNHNYLIIGFGRFGQGFVSKLIEEGVKPKNIYVVDYSNDFFPLLLENGIENTIQLKMHTINDIAPFIPIYDIDYFVIGTSNLEASLSIAHSIVSNHDLENKIIYAKAGTKLHFKLLTFLGISNNNVVIPEEEVGRKLALSSFFEGKATILDLWENISIINIKLTNKSLDGLSINEVAKIWEEENHNRNWSIIVIKDEKSNNIIPMGNNLIFLGYSITLTCNKKDRKKVVNFLTKTKK